MRGKPRNRRYVRGRGWRVHARVERFVEPAVLLLLRERPMHGYELLEHVPELAGEERRVDAGNLYRVLRALEEDGMVRSEWNADLPGPAKRTYELTESGRALLARWSEALRDAQAVLAGFLDRYEEEGR